MCGIFGYIGKSTKTKLLIDGLQNLEYRGYDSAGLAFLQNDEIKIFKESGKIDNLKEKINENTKFKLGISHTRWATHGNATKENAHPHLSFSKKFAIVHNGIIENYNALKECYLKNVILNSETDSEIIAHLIDLFFRYYLLFEHQNLFKDRFNFEKFFNLRQSLNINKNKSSYKNINIDEKNFDIIKDSNIINFEVLKELDLKKYTSNLTNQEINKLIKLSISRCCSLLKGSFALAVISSLSYEYIYLAKKESPLMIGINKNCSIFSSDVNTLSCFCYEFLIMQDNQIAEINSKEINLYNNSLKKLKKKFLPFEEKNNIFVKQDCLMKQEIKQSPTAILKTLNIFNEQFKLIDKNFWKNIKCVYLIGCGTAFHSCLLGKKYLEQCLDIPIITEISSEFITNNLGNINNKNNAIKHITNKTLCVFVSQSGETADTLSAIKLAKKLKCKILAITNNKTSSMSFLCNNKIIMGAGWERAVASTKAYMCQIEVFYLLTESLKGNFKQAQYCISQLSNKLKTFKIDNWAKSLADMLINFEKIIFIGRQSDYITAMEASLKLKEITYLNSIAVASGELKHGTLALVDNKTLVFSILTENKLLDKNINTIKEVLARGAKVVLITNQFSYKKIIEDIKLKEQLNFKNGKDFKNNIRFKDNISLKDNISFKDDINIILPNINSKLYPILSIYPLQELACEVCLKLGYNPDTPRNLSKSVTVE